MEHLNLCTKPQIKFVETSLNIVEKKGNNPQYAAWLREHLRLMKKQFARNCRIGATDRTVII